MSKFLDFQTCFGKSLPYSHVIFESTSHFPFKFCINIQCCQKYFLYTFLAQTFYTLVQSSSLKCKFLRFLNALMKICQNPHVIFQTARKFSFKFHMTLQCHERYLLSTFLGQRLCTLHKRDQSKCKFLSILKQQIGFCSNFA